MVLASAANLLYIIAMRWMSLAMVAGLAGSASASFDLLLVLDSGQGVVHRYDGDTGVYLGNFGGGTLGTVRGITVDKASSTAFVSHDNGYSSWNYNTGTFNFYLGIFGPTVDDISTTSDGQLLFAAISGLSPLRKASNFGTSPVTSIYSMGGFSSPAVSAVEGPGGYWAIKASNGSMGQFSSTSSTFQGSLLNAGLLGISKGTGDGTNFVGLNSSGAAVRAAFGSTGSATGASLTNPFTSAVEFEFGHAGEGWGLGVNGSGTRLQRYAKNSAGNWDALGPGRTLSQVTTPVGMAVVTAPEPGTMIALGLGTVALLRRRKARAS